MQSNWWDGLGDEPTPQVDATRLVRLIAREPGDAEVKTRWLTVKMPAMLDQIEKELAEKDVPDEDRYRRARLKQMVLSWWRWYLKKGGTEERRPQERSFRDSTRESGGDAGLRRVK